jgi:hypothetical protein
MEGCKREKNKKTCKGESFETPSDFSTENLKTKRGWAEVF